MQTEEIHDPSKSFPPKDDPPNKDDPSKDEICQTEVKRNREHALYIIK